MSEDQHTAPQTTSPPTMSRRTNVLAVGAVVLGVLGAATAPFPRTAFLGFVAGTLALILGLVGWRRPPLRGLAVAGAVLGLVALGLAFVGLSAEEELPTHPHSMSSQA